MATPRKRIGELLVEARAIDQMQLQAALGYQRQWGGRIGQVLVQRGFITEQKLVEALGGQLRVPIVQLGRTRIDARALSLVPANVAEQLHLFPLELKGNEKTEQLVVAMSDPTDLDAMDQLQFRTRKRVLPVLAGDLDIAAAIRRHYYSDEVAGPAAVSHKSSPPLQPARASADPFADSDLSGGEEPLVPGLVAWGQGEVAPRQQPTPRPPPAPAAMQPALAMQPTPRPSVMPTGVPPGFGSTDPRTAVRGRTLQAPQGQKAPVQIAADLDPFAELEPELPDPLRGTDPIERHSQPPAAAEALEFEDLPDPLAGTSPDAWKADLEPIAAHIHDPSDPHAGGFRADGVALEELETIEELDVDVEMLEADVSTESMLETPSESAAAHSTHWPQEQALSLDDGWESEAAPMEIEHERFPGASLEEPAPLEAAPLEAAPLTAEVDAAAEGWLTPSEDASADPFAAPAEGGWDAPVEADAAWIGEPTDSSFDIGSDGITHIAGASAAGEEHPPVAEAPVADAADPWGTADAAAWGEMPAEPAAPAEESAWPHPEGEQPHEALAPETPGFEADSAETTPSEWVDSGWETAPAAADAAPAEEPPAEVDVWAEAEAALDAEPSAEQSLEAWDAALPAVEEEPLPGAELLGEPQPVEVAADEWLSAEEPQPEHAAVAEEAAPALESGDPWSTAETALSNPDDIPPETPEVPWETAASDAEAVLAESHEVVATDDSLAAWGAPEEPVVEAPVAEEISAWGAPEEPVAEAQPADEISAWGAPEEPVSEPQHDEALAAWAGAEEPVAEAHPSEELAVEAAHEEPAPVAEEHHVEAAADDALAVWAGVDEEIPVAEHTADTGEAAAWAAADEQAYAPAVDVPAEEVTPMEQSVADEWAGFGAASEPENTAPVETAAPSVDEHPIEAPAVEELQRSLDAAPVVAHSAPEDTTRTAAPMLSGWQWIGIEQPTERDAVRVVGALVQLLVQRGMVDAAELAAAMRQAEELSR